ncbi:MULTISPECIES: hypothetical protein [Microcystis]|uniref:Uncharacterized protein n=1 Tax=Microcystis aeruginosa PCC 7806SL TaxID=1903187 RepID=A0AB33BY04_MICA7|nr:MULTISPECIES: hypothetical protein [Microcystis]ARI82225.1 hypothetical protein BH695_2946 [Microcystis aeruginosa PCC 7806SL]ELS46257.1 hypothetical protein C789_3946 [Microcystis aeruginosa FACHB-905 = DIANCHI905]MBE9243512.1 hypothetical protein [Microcystis aeruginosa LEGE 00239]WKX61976.1 hypothetical protein Q3H53_001943 [Microcystis aeruginosa PCC 7806]
MERNYELWLSWIWWVKCILRYIPPSEGVEGTTPDTEDTKIDRFSSKLNWSQRARYARSHKE